MASLFVIVLGMVLAMATGFLYLDSARAAYAASLEVSPASGYPNSLVTLDGSGFPTGTGYVWFDTDHDGILDPGEPFQVIESTGGPFVTTLAVTEVAAADYNNPRLYIRADFPPVGSPPGGGFLDINRVFTVLSPPFISINDVSASEGNSGITNFAFTVTSNPAPSSAISINYAVSDGTATTGGSDYIFSSGTITLDSANPTRTIIISIIGDTTVEPNETFFVNLSNPTGALISDSQGVGTILNDDTTVNLAPSVNAGPDQTITLPASASLGGTVTDDGLPSGTLVISWSKVSGPGNVMFSAPSAASTDASFSESGTYTLRLAASDSQLSSTDDVIIVVNPIPPPPVTDSDGDGVLDDVDSCPTIPASTPDGCPVITDTDNDGVPDAYDQCPSDPNKAFPGTQGCGNSETESLEQQIASLNQQILDLQNDTDQDGVPDLFDQCASDPAKVFPGLNGCGAPEPDFNQVILELQNTISNLGNQIIQLQESLASSNPVYCGIAQNSWPVVIRGSPNNDKLIGTNNNDLIIGFGGDDKIIGKQGNDCLVGGPGEDRIFGNRGNDVILGGDGNDRIHGGQGSDNIDGEGGTDRCYGGQGSNVINSCEIPDKNIEDEEE